MGIVRDDDLRMIDCVGFAWQVVEALGNPLLHRRVTASVERDLRRVIGDDYVDLLKVKSKEPQRPRSMNEVHAWARELVLRDVGHSLGKRKRTPVEEMIDLNTDPTRVACVRHHVERIMAKVLR